jgi:hypothetical protein
VVPYNPTLFQACLFLALREKTISRNAFITGSFFFNSATAEGVCKLRRSEMIVILPYSQTVGYETITELIDKKFLQIPAGGKMDSRLILRLPEKYGLLEVLRSIPDGAFVDSNSVFRIEDAS